MVTLPGVPVGPNPGMNDTSTQQTLARTLSPDLSKIQRIIALRGVITAESMMAFPDRTGCDKQFRILYYTTQTTLGTTRLDSL